MKNYYPELPEIPYKKTSVKMSDVIEYANSITEYPIEVKRMAYIMFRNESANGLKGVNNNYAGIQADNARWSGLKGAVATSVRIDSGKQLRRFICFDDASGYKDTFNFLCVKVQQRGMYIGAFGIREIDELVPAYLKKWVGRINTKPSIAELNNWKSLYRSAKEAIK
jgi:hypothetical protein